MVTPDRYKLLSFCQVMVLLAVCFGLHSVNYNHEFLLDSSHVLVDNEAIRDLANIPAFFRDPATFSNLRQNWDYRPILQVTYALNYFISGYGMWSYHFFQVFLHFCCASGIYFFGRRVLSVFSPDENKDVQIWIAFTAALFFAAHPYTSGVVNYLSARSSLLTAVFLIYSLLNYMGKKISARKSGPPWLALILYSLALFTKVEAVAALGVYLLYEVISQGKVRHDQREGTGTTFSERMVGGFLGDVVRSLNLNSLGRLWPFLVVTIIYGLVRKTVVPDFIAEARHSVDVTSFIYLCTQLTAWWHYVLQWFAPVNLVGDNLAYPIFHSVLEPQVLLAAGGWLVVGLVLKACYRTHPEYMFLTITALALISPTSSVAPLAEMVNEHRPYLPLVVLSLVFVTVGGRWAADMIAAQSLTKLQVGTGVVVMVTALALLTIDRNKVYATSEAFWADVNSKAPSARGHVNYGLALRRKGNEQAAMSHFLKSLELAPRWHITHINIAIGYEMQGNIEKAHNHYSFAVRDEMYGSQALEYRGNFHLRMKEYREAVADLEQSLVLTTNHYTVYRGIATGAAGIGDWQKAVVMTEKMCDLKPQACENEIVGIATPFWNSPEFYEPGIKYFQALDAFLPGRWWVQENIENLTALQVLGK